MRSLLLGAGLIVLVAGCPASTSNPLASVTITATGTAGEVCAGYDLNQDGTLTAAEIRQHWADVNNGQQPTDLDVEELLESCSGQTETTGS
jgi:hypothetical protein